VAAGNWRFKTRKRDKINDPVVEGMIGTLTSCYLKMRGKTTTLDLTWKYWRKSKNKICSNFVWEKVAWFKKLARVSTSVKG